MVDYELMDGRGTARVRQQRIDDRALIRFLVKDRKSQAECAAHFGVSEQAVSKRIKYLGLDAVRQSAPMAHLEAAQRGAFDIAGRITELDGLLQEELTKLRNGAVEVTEPQRFERLVTLVSESRKTVGVAIELSRALAAMQQVAEFREVVLDALSEFPEVKAALLAKLRERATLRRALTVNGAEA